MEIVNIFVCSRLEKEEKAKDWEETKYIIVTIIVASEMRTYIRKKKYMAICYLV